MTVLIYKDGILDFASPEEMRYLKEHKQAGQRLMGLYCKVCSQRLDIDDLYVHDCSIEESEDYCDHIYDSYCPKCGIDS